MKYLFLSLLSIIVFTASFAQSKSNIWLESKTKIVDKLESDRYLHPTHFKTFILDIESLKEQLIILDNQEFVSIVLPMPNGNLKAYNVKKTMVMPRVLAMKYPNIKTYTGYNGDEVVKLDITEEGFHAMILSKEKSTIFIDPYAKNNTEYYLSYAKKDYRRLNGPLFECGVSDLSLTKEYVDPLISRSLGGDCQLRTYELALACTGEYAAYHGGTVAGALSAMNTSMNRVNGVYERDLSLTLVLVPNNDEVIFLDAGSDPYSNGNGSAMLNQNQTTCDNIIGFNNYDIGHVFSTGGGGIASLNSPCTGGKARGVTGSGNPVGDPFDIDYVAHEMGHQFGGNHTQSNSCNSTGFSSVEPGSASSIMGYAGICSPNVQNNSDDYYHSFNILEIVNYMVFGGGNSCASLSSNGNNAPSISVESNNYTIPYSTPFKLTASATDFDGDNLTYCWEQMDASTAPMPPQGTSVNGPLFRTLNPVSSPTRYFLKLDALFANSDPTWEELPEVARSMSFNCTVRDNHMGLGCTDEATVNITVAGTGPFEVTTANAPTVWDGGSTETVTWNTGGTGIAPVNCAYVDILLWREGGDEEPIMIVEHVPNSGSATFQVPNMAGNDFRLLIQANDNIFFDISDANITINEISEPSYTVTGIDNVYEACIGDTVILNYTINSFGGFDQLVNIYLSLNDNDVDVIGAPTEVAPGAYSIMVIPTDNTPNSIFLVFHSSYNGNPTSTGFTINYVEQPLAPLQVLPVDGAVGVGNSVVLSWQSFNTSGNVTILVDTNPDFLNAQSYSTGLSTKTISGLQGSTIYYWKIRGANGCGESDFSDIFAFQTAGTGCNTYFAEPGGIINEAQPLYYSFDVVDEFNIAAIILEFDISHTYVGDLSVSLEHNGLMNSIFENPGVPNSQFGCSGNDLLVGFDDVNGASYDIFEGTCNNNPAISGVFESIDNNLLNFIGEQANGEYTFEVTDSFNDDDGIFNSFTMTLCFDEEILNQLILVNNNVLYYANGGSSNLQSSHLMSEETDLTTSDISYVVLRLPEFGFISNNGNILNIGDVFTQLDIDLGYLIYNSTDIDAAEDNMLVDITSSTNSWIHNVTFNFATPEGVLTLLVDQVDNLLCYDDNSGSVTLSILNGVEPFTYSLDGVNYQDSPTFNGLPAGEYTFYVLDANDDASTVNVTIIQPQLITIDAIVVNGQLIVTTNGGSGDMNIDAPSDFVNGEIVTITATDNNNCEVQLDFEIHIIEENILIENPECFVDGIVGSTVSFIPTNGVEPYAYSLDNGGFVDNNTFNDVTPGNHSVVITDANQNQTVINFVTSLPILLESTVSVSWSEVTVEGLGGVAPYTYSSNGVDFSVENVFNLEDGEYSITTMDANGCVVISVVQVSDTDIVDGFNAQISVYPNPNTGNFEINLGELNEHLNIKVFNTIGQLIHQEIVNSSIEKQVSINLDVASGVYQLVINNSASAYVEKLIVLE